MRISAPLSAILAGAFLSIAAASAGELQGDTKSVAIHPTPPCYEPLPTTCSFDDMTLAFCNVDGKKAGLLFLPSQRIHVAGGNTFATADGKTMCFVRRKGDGDPPRYEVTIFEY